MKTTMKTLGLLLALALLCVSPALAAPAVDVGGVPLIVTLQGTSAGTAADVTWTTAPGFIPDYVKCIDESDGEPNVYEWFKGMANESAMKTTGSSGVITYISEAGADCGIDTDTAGTIVIDASCQTNSEAYSCIAIRYAQ